MPEQRKRGPGPMRRDDPVHKAAGQRWCERHQRWECTRSAKRGGQCHGAPIRGLDACRMHAGKRSSVARAQGQALQAFRAELGAEVDPAAAVLGMLAMAWARATFYARLLEHQVDADGTATVGLDVDGEPAGSGLVGHTFGAVKDIGVYATGEAVRALVQLEAQERDRVVRFAKTAHDMGIAEAQIRLAEQQGQLLAGGLSWLLGELGLAADVRARSLTAAMLRALAEGRTPAQITAGGAT